MTSTSSEERRSARESQSTAYKGSFLETLLVAQYFGSGILFIVGYSLPVWRSVVYPISGNLLDWDTNVFPVVWTDGHVLATTAWAVINASRLLVVILQRRKLDYFDLETTRVSYSTQRTRDQPKASSLAIFFCVLQLFLALWCGYASNPSIGYYTTDESLIAAGLVLLFTSESALLLLHGYEVGIPSTWK